MARQMQVSTGCTSVFLVAQGVLHRVCLSNAMQRWYHTGTEGWYHSGRQGVARPEQMRRPTCILLTRASAWPYLLPAGSLSRTTGSAAIGAVQEQLLA